MENTLSRRKRDGTIRIIAVWSPTATGKSTIATNLAAYLSEKEKEPVALVDLTQDHAVYTYTNCTKPQGLKRLINGDPHGYHSPLHAPKLRVYTTKPGSKSVFNGEASKLSSICKTLSDHIIVFDLQRDHLRAANALVLADKVLLVADYNFHSVYLAKIYTQQLTNKLLVINQHSEENMPAFSVSEMLDLEPAAIFPDRGGLVLKRIFDGSLLFNEPDFEPEFERLIIALGRGKSD